MLSQTISPLNVTQAFAYDSVNRLLVAAENPANPSNPQCPDSSSQWCQQFGYDQWGNRWVAQTAGAGDDNMVPQSNVFGAATNQLNASYFVGQACPGGSPYYDPAGNLNCVSPYSLAYDAENRQISATSSANGSMTYSYDGNGRRVMVTTGAGTTIFVYDAMGNLAAEYTTEPQTTVAGTSYLTVDHLGSTRMTTDSTGTIPARFDYQPFGKQLSTTNRATTAGYGQLGPRQKFTGKERDTETGLDFFGARYFSGAQGRFTSPDLPVDQHPGDPQSWNLYTYVRNNPLSMTDPSGNYACGTYVSADQCAAFGNMLTQAQATLDKAKKAGDIDSDQYKTATKALGAYGTLDDGNGVTVNVGATGGYPGMTFARNGGEKTDANLTGQDIKVTLNGKLFDQGSSPALLGAIAHEGSHVEDAEAWAKAGFTAAADPTNFKTEYAAYGVSVAMGQAQNSHILSATKPGGTTSMVFWDSQKSVFQNQDLRTNMIKAFYPNWSLKAFQANTNGTGK
jgi:RHS repeat-associated protein